MNQRAEGAPRMSCGEDHGKAIVARFKELIAENKLRMKVRAQRASCFDWCEKGPIVMVHPEQIIYGGVTLEDVEEIFTSHILCNTPVDRLKLNS
ncbi:MAG: (2Fe-2S) ferredoxin domain-containing protein [Flavobacteriales bacterium]|nr:(2Fe-2S) ferredoxin domain-containing protein [Flavobacteriales bacterium]